MEDTVEDASGSRVPHFPALTSSAEAAFAHVVERLLTEAEVSGGKAFHSAGLAARGKIFAMLVKDELVLKLPAERCSELLEAGVARPFSSGKRVMREWIAVRDPDERRWLKLADEALAFARR